MVALQVLLIEFARLSEADRRSGLTLFAELRFYEVGQLEFGNRIDGRLERFTIELAVHLHPAVKSPCVDIGLLPR